MTLDSTGAGSAQVDAPSLGESWVAICTMDEPVSFTLSTGGHVIAYGSAGQSASFVVASGQAITVKVTGGTASSTLCGTITGTTGKGEPPPLQYARSGSQVEIDLDPSHIAYEFLGYSPAAIGPYANKAAPASHAHPLGKNLAAVSGFGYSVQIFPGELIGNSDGVITTAKHLPALDTWTIDIWQNSSISAQGFIGAFIDSTAGDALSQPDAFTGYAGFLQECSANSTDYFAVNNNASTLLMPSHTGAWHLFSMQCDGHQTTCFIDGVAAGTLPAFSVPAACWGIDSTQTAQCAGSSPPLDEFRVSNIARYNPAGFTPPTAPFQPDAETLVLWHFDDAPFAGTFFSESDGSWTLYNGAGDFFFQDSSGNGNVGYLADHVGYGYLVTMTAALAGITAQDGVSYGYVNSIQGKTGPMELTDTSGNSIATAVPVAGGPTQLQMAGLSAGATPWTSVPYWLLRVD